MTAHALLSASGSHRWLNCPPSARLEQGYEDKGSSAAAEGTLAHAVAEFLLKNHLNGIPSDHIPDEYTKSEYFSPAMVDYVNVYKEYCLERINAIKAKEVYYEQKLDFSSYVLDGFGTADCVLVGDNEIEIVDLKYGKGVEVMAEDNPQLQLYALGVIDGFRWFYGFDKVTMTIVQPRLNSISSQTKLVAELLEWGEKVVKPTAKLAYMGNGKLCAGSWCQFCKVGVRCRTYSEYSTEAVKGEFENLDQLTDNEVAELLGKSDRAIKYLNKLKDYALEEALAGKEWPGFKLVEGRSNRKIIDEPGVAEVLAGEGYGADIIYKPQELNTITTLEKYIGKKKFGELAGGFVVKPQGKPTLVPETDKRPKLDLTCQFEDLGEEGN